MSTLCPYTYCVVLFDKDLISQLENKVSLTETRCAELAMEVDELTAHVKVTLQIQIKLPHLTIPPSPSPYTGFLYRPTRLACMSSEGKGDGGAGTAMTFSVC